MDYAQVQKTAQKLAHEGDTIQLDILLDKLAQEPDEMAQALSVNLSSLRHTAFMNLQAKSATQPQQ